ncbi:MAG TPA: hypothetical protein VKS21_10720 [Spirochaetota bacterium]|nr:hypothetical protein [Spirochaetota bacterium]
MNNGSKGPIKSGYVSAPSLTISLPEPLSKGNQESATLHAVLS